MTDFRWLIEAPGPRYLSVRRLTVSRSDEFDWTAAHDKALAFRSKDQADAMMMALRQMDRQCNKGALFAFEATLGNARPVEHGWMDDRITCADLTTPCDAPLRKMPPTSGPAEYHATGFDADGRAEG